MVSFVGCVNAEYETIQKEKSKGRIPLGLAVVEAGNQEGEGE